MSSSGTCSEYLDEEIRGEEFGPSIDDHALSAAARRARLPPDRPTEHEFAFFPEIWEHKTSVEVFLLIRNTTLATWQLNPMKECTTLDVRNNVFPPFNSDLDLIQNIVHYLTRHGIINFGRYQRSTKINKFLVRAERKVIVIGAGAAGIAAATQLTSFGFDVTILEGRHRIGGRINSFKTKSGQLMESGADTLRKLEDSPMLTLLHQVNMEEHGIYDNTTMFVDGKSLSEDRASIVLGHYLSASGALNYQAHINEHRDENGMYISRQQAYENLLNMCERTTLIKYYNHCKTLESIAKQREEHFNTLKTLKNTAMLAENKLKQMEMEGRLDDDVTLRRSLKRDIASCMSKFNEVANAFEACENQWTHVTEHPAPKQYMDPGSDFSTYNFMLGFEEYLIGADLEQVQFSCDAVQNKENGMATRVTEGLHELLNRVIERRGLDIRLRHRVLDIDYSGKDQVKVKVVKRSGEIETMSAAIVVCTLPIGVLKKTVANEEGVPTFTPPLPDKKQEAIRCMGSGLVNKCVMEFERPFWANSNRYQFVTVQPNLRTRGSMSIWSSVPDSRILTTYLVGQEAYHSVPDDVIVQNAIQNLQKVFGNQCPRVPLSAHITRWQDDEFSFGSGSFMSLRTEPHHFDDLMTPLNTADGSPRVFFAGEHTCASYTSTVQGAWMSGARAATDIANHYNGVGFVDLTGSRRYADGEEDDEEIIHIDHDGPMEEFMPEPPKRARSSDDEPGPSSN